MSNNTTFDLNEYLSEEKRNVERLSDSSNFENMPLKNPSKKTVNTILSFSRALEVTTSKQLGSIEHLMN
tara:strand:- start:1085 stop:1291 length:207 start_codon:yes stop_codon:yes gene_type:complete